MMVLQITKIQLILQQINTQNPEHNKNTDNDNHNIQYATHRVSERSDNNLHFQISGDYPQWT